MGNAAARVSACIDLEVVIWGGEGGSVSSVVLIVEEDTGLEGCSLCLRDFGRDDGTSRFRPRHSDTQASADLPQLAAT